MAEEKKKYPETFIHALKALKMLGWEFRRNYTSIRGSPEDEWEDFPDLPHHSLDACFKLLVRPLEKKTGLRFGGLIQTEEGTWRCSFIRDVAWCEASDPREAIIHAVIFALEEEDE